MSYSIIPKHVPRVETQYRKICTDLPVPESIPLLDQLRSIEAESLAWQYPVFWDRAENYNVYDKYGNKWLDFSAGIAVANVGHSRKEICDAIIAQVQHGLLYNFTFPSELRLKLLERLVKMSPPYLQKGFFMSAGSEACENVLKLIRKYNHIKYGKQRNVVVTFEGAFHGRTLGAQLMGGLPPLKDWIVHPDPDIIQVPFPDGYFNENVSFDLFEQTLAAKGITPDRVAGVFVEPFQGANLWILPIPYAQKLAAWCKQHNVLLAFDEVQSGFGRMGELYGYQYYGIECDIIALGKALSCSLPISGTLARKEIMDIFPSGTMTSTHTGNAVAVAAAIANLDLYQKEKMTEQARTKGKILQEETRRIQQKYKICGVAVGVGMVSGIQIVTPGTKTTQTQWAYDIAQKIIEKGVLVYNPHGKACLKFTPPFTIPEDALREGMAVVDEAIGEFIREHNLS